MKLLITISVFLCSLFVREPVFANAGANRCITTCTAGKPITKEKAVSAPQTGFGIDEISLFDEDDDNEFSTNRKKIQLQRSFNNANGLLLLQESGRSVFNPGFGNNTYSLPGAERCIFQRVIRV